MNLHLSKRDILKKTAQFGSFTFLSKILGIIREVLIARFFGVGAISDAFIMSFRIPNFFRQVFAEGALNASFIPAFIKTVKEGKREQSNGLMTLSFLAFESVILLMYVFVFFKTEWVIRLIAPGFSQEQIYYAIPFLRILFPFLFFVSSSTLFAGVLQSVNCFAVPAFGPVLWNIVYVGSLILALYWHLSPNIVCFGIIFGGFLWMVMNAFFYLKYGFRVGKITSDVVILFRDVLKRFLPCLFGVSIVELNLFVGTVVASFLPTGSLTLLYLSSRFMNIPLGAFAVALSNILLSHFSRIVLYAPRRLNYYILEVTKLVTWVILPSVLFLMFVSEPLFSTVLLVKSGNLQQTTMGAGLLRTYLIGLLFFSMNKILLSVFYSLKDTKSTMIASSISALVNVGGDISGMLLFGAYGIAGAASLSGLVMTVACFYFLRKKHKFRFYSGRYFDFLWRYLAQLLFVIASFLWGHGLFTLLIKNTYCSHFFINGFGFWVLTGALGALSMLFLFYTKKMFGIKLHFLDK
ncbi:MAG: hypothetical protein US49_C0002G0038 [candidate division TM6 bacterium GW2011_GWF2_37_49]|nr:MAG: hypothetical protein US49_C0002G0038 [candidate division TM6 bacterium GW2011_GWF2_37_49]